MKFSLRRIHLPNRHCMQAELGTASGADLDAFEALYASHSWCLKLIFVDSAPDAGIIAWLSRYNARCWLSEPNAIYLFTDSQACGAWGRTGTTGSAVQDELLGRVQTLMRHLGRSHFEMAGEQFMFQFGGPTRIMGILNATPDSFFDGGQFESEKHAIQHALAMEAAGADIIDVGGESSRPGALPLSEGDELKRVIPVIEQLSGELQVPISIDTYKSQVAEAAIQAGATIINDISGFRFDAQMRDVVKHYGVPAVLMHMQGTPKDMQENPQYQNVMDEIYLFFENLLAALREHGLPANQFVIDPGLGFGKRLWDNYTILQRLQELRGLGCPVLVGPSRKAFIGKALDLPVEERLEGTAAAVSASVLGGCQIVRVHDVQEMLRVVQIADLICGNVVIADQELPS